MAEEFDWIVIGSGFGGSVSALRLTEKGYKVLVIEKGKRFGKKDFPKTNWDLKRWLWAPALGLQGIFQMSFLEHVSVLHGVGVGGGSLVYANTLPEPKDKFFEANSWSHLAHWKDELAPHYRTAKRMLGVARNPEETEGDRVLKEIAKDIGREDQYHLADVAVYFGKPGRKVADPYFDGKGPSRTGCTFCGACMTGCRVGAKNTLDLNYLYLAERGGCRIEAELEVKDVEPHSGGYEVTCHPSLKNGGSRPEGPRRFKAKRVVFAGGVMGTVPLLLSLRERAESLPKLSTKLGTMIRTNSESLTGVVQPNNDKDLTHGIAITSVLHTDDNSHVEPVRYGKGSGFFRLLSVPHAPNDRLLGRVGSTAKQLLVAPARFAKSYATRDFARNTQILLFMQTLDGTLDFELGRSVFTGFKRGLRSKLSESSEAPKAFLAEATDIARRYTDKVGGTLMNLASELFLGTPTTAHILGGCTMGSDDSEGVINHRHEVFGYEGLYVIDGSAVSANPGVNPSLTITAMAERAMSFIEDKNTVPSTDESTE